RPGEARVMQVLEFHVILWPVLIPLAASALCMMLWHRPRAQRAVYLPTLVLMFFAAMALLWQVSAHDVLALTIGGWQAPFGISFIADRLSAAMVLVTGVLTLAIGVYSLSTTRRRHVRNGVYPLLFGLLAAVNGAFLTGDIFNLYVWFE